MAANQLKGFKGENRFGRKYVVTKALGVAKRNMRWEVRFTESGFVTAAAAKEIRSGKISDWDGKPSTSVGRTFETSYGPALVLENLGKVADKKGSRVRVRFLRTGYETECGFSALKNNGVRDRSVNGFCGVGNGSWPKNRKRSNVVDYAVWKLWTEMMRRCYAPTHASFRFYGARGVKVCDRWLHFKNFSEDVIGVPGYDTWENAVRAKKQGERLKVHLDKDLIRREGLYSPDLCKFVDQSENVRDAVNRRWENSGDARARSIVVNGVVWSSVREYASHTGVSEVSVRSWLKGRKKPAKHRGVEEIRYET